MQAFEAKSNKHGQQQLQKCTPAFRATEIQMLTRQWPTNPEQMTELLNMKHLWIKCGFVPFKINKKTLSHMC